MEVLKMDLLYDPGNPEDLIDKKVNLFVAQMTYPELVNFLLVNRNPKQAEEDLQDVAKRISKKLLEYWKPKSKTLKGVIKDLIKFIWAGKFKSEVLEWDFKKRPLRMLLIDKDCKLCKAKDLPIFHQDLKEIHYCAAVSGFIDEYLNQLAVISHIKLAFKSVEVNTVSSIGSGDDRCAHLCKFKY